MAKRIIENDEYDFTISRTAKYIVAISAQLLSWTIWGFFSTPATIEFCRRFSTDVKVLNIYSGEIMGIIAGVTFSILEMLFTEFWLWKRNNIYWIGIGICMAVSIAATTGFTNIGHQQAEIKYDSIQNAEAIVQNTRDAIKREEKQYASYDREEKYFQQSQGYVPSYVSARRRQSQERLNALNAQLNSQTNNVTQIKQTTGAIVTIDPLKSKNKIINFSNFIAVMLEIFIVVLLIASNAVWKKIDPPSAYAERTKSASDADADSAKVADVGQLKGGLKSGVRPVIVSASPGSRPIGFGRTDADKSDNEHTAKSDNKTIVVNSVQAICMIYDTLKEMKKPYTKRGIADMVGCDESWVRKVLKKKRGI